MLERAKQTASFSVKSGGILGGVSGFVGDFLTPIAPFGVYIAAASLGALLLALMLWAILPRKLIRELHAKYNLNPDESFWFAPLAAALLLLSSISYASYTVSSNYGDNHSGVLGGVVPEVQQLQISLGIIAKNTESIVSEIQNTNAKLDESNILQNEIASNTNKSVEQQNLTNKAVFWNLQTLQDALIRGDLDTLELFRSEGHDLSQVNQPSSSAPLAEAMIVYAVRQNPRNIDEVLKYLVQHRAIDLNKVYHTTIHMNPSINSLWQRMEVHKNVDSYVEKGAAFAEFQQAMLAKGYEVPDNLQSGYKKFSGDFISGPAGVKTTLLVESLYAGNVKAASYLIKHASRTEFGSIDLSNGVKIRLMPYLIALQSEETGIRSLAVNLK